MKVYIHNLGCKINQFDGGVLKDGLIASGLEVVSGGEAADVYVINTCTVTKKSDYHCRQAIRRAVEKKGEGGMVVVTGCYAQTNSDEIKAIPGVDVVVGNDARDKLRDIILKSARHDDADENGILSAQGFGGRSRAYLKVQDGCGTMCSYCIVPYARGASMSAQVEDVLDKAGSLIEKGYHEIVLTGVHLGAYGRDLGGGTGITALVRRLLELPGLGRLRLSSIEPMEIDEGLMELAGSGKLCRHFHVPLQSAVDKVLESMGRGYTSGEYFNIMAALSKRVNDPCLGADVIVGYPTEDRDSFEETVKKIGDSPINYLHVFSYSPRPGTRAYAMGDPVRGDEKKERSLILRELATKKNMAFRSKFVGDTMTVVLEDNGRETSGLTDNYIRVRFDGSGSKPGSAVDVSILEAQNDFCTGVVV